MVIGNQSSNYEILIGVNPKLYNNNNNNKTTSDKFREMTIFLFWN